MLVEGNIISGEFDQGTNEFLLQKVKHFTTQSTIRENQLNSLYHYLKSHQHDEYGQIITLYDQMPVRLNQEEVDLFMQDLERIKYMYYQ